jgi:hypothetical protein
MAEAIFGLVGVVVGGLLTAGANWLATRADRRRSRRLAARILSDELSYHRVYIQGRLDKGEVVRLPDHTSLHEAWLEHRVSLADLPWSDYGVVQHAVLIIVRMPVDPDRPRASTDAMRSALDVIDDAAGVLKKHGKE